MSSRPTTVRTTSVTRSAIDAAQAPASNRASWRGLLRLSLVSVPIKAYPATTSGPESRFHQLHAGCGQRVRYEKHCPIHGKLDASAITKGYEYAPDQFIVLDEEALDRIRPARERALCLERLVPYAHIEPALFSGRSLYLLPDGPAARTPYGLLTQAMAAGGKCAVGRIGLSGQRPPVLVRAVSRHLIMHVLYYPDLLRACPAENIEPVMEPDTEERALASQLVATYSGDVSWGDYSDDSAVQLAALVEATLAGRAPAEVADDDVPVLRLADALKQSIAAAGQSATDAAVPSATKRRKRPSRKTA